MIAMLILLALAELAAVSWRVGVWAERRREVRDGDWAEAFIAAIGVTA